MSTTEVQLRFAAEFALVLVSLGGLGLALLRPELIVSRRLPRAAALVGFASLASAAVLRGALVVDDPTSPVVIGLRLGAVVLLALASRWWRPGNGGRVLLWIGLVALVAAMVVTSIGESAHPGLVPDAARGIGALALGVALVAASTRAISARLAASAGFPAVAH
ncbi:MAG: hypothetical protein Q8K72_04570, partial [Acidimicrobiales bacterium]|nr:hypothetical protein [Acidimicrobiales bacterium]